MRAVTTIFPVIFMIGIGTFSRIRGFITPSQKDGANKIVFNILFPIMIFNILFTSKLETSAIFIVLYNKFYWGKICSYFTLLVNDM